MRRHNQDDIGILINSSTRNIQGIKGSNHLSKTIIWVYRRMKRLPNRTEITYRERDTSMDIRKAKDNFDKNRKPKCFNCNIYECMAKDC